MSHNTHASPGKTAMSSPSPSRHRRTTSQSSVDSDSSRTTATGAKATSSPYNPASQPVRPSAFVGPTANASTTSLHSFSRPLPRGSNQAPGGEKAVGWQPGHRPRQHSQGFFEPSLPSTTANPQGMASLTAEIAAREAMHVQAAQHTRKRSQTIPDPSSSTPTEPRGGKRPSAFAQASNPNVRFNDGFIGGHSLAAATAANISYPRSGQYSPGLPHERAPPPPVPEKDIRPNKEKSKMKLFSKPKNIGLSKEKELERKYPALPSPNKIGYAYKGANMSSTSLIDPVASSAASLYSNANSSTSTLVPLEREREKHKHHFLLRQKNKMKDDHYNLPVSSASSTSRPADPSAPQSLYSFAAPTSPSHSSTFAKSVSGLDLRHGGRALREKKKEEKAAALGPAAPIGTSLVDLAYREREQSFGQGSEWLGPPTYSSFGPSTAATGASGLSDGLYPFPTPDMSSLGSVFGVPGIGPDDAWPLLKARVLNIFEGEDPRPPIEDFNHLATVHLRNCIQQRAPMIIVEDLTELLRTGFLSLDQTLKHIPDERLVPHLVNMWVDIFTKILPFMQAVFHPLDLEFKGRGSLMTSREAAEFWGAALPEPDISRDTKGTPSLGEDLDVRKITLLTFRDTVILPRHDALKAIFSRLSLESINASVADPRPPSPIRPPPPLTTGSGPPSRPGTATSSRAADVTGESYNSAASTLLDTASPFSTPALSLTRSRATSNTSAGSFNSMGNIASSTANHTPPAMDSAKVTEMVGRMLQCVSVLASVQSGDDSQERLEGLCRELKYNWLGRGRTGRQRRGFVGTKTKRTIALENTAVAPIGA